MHNSSYSYTDGAQELIGFLAYDDTDSQQRPAVLVAHDWTGCNDFVCEKARILAKMGYVGFAIDMYGDGKLGATNAEKSSLMQPLMDSRVLLRNRIEAAFNTIINLPCVDKARVAAIGFCFGGLCVLDLARSGVSLKAAVSFHGLLNKPRDLPSKKILAKLLVLHGFDDPMVKIAEVDEFCQDMTKSQVDWQVQMYSHTQHAFMNPEAHDLKLGTVYNPQTEHRAWQAMTNFLQDIFI